jgi:DNA-binding Xre family transcriptional regulator
VDGVNGFIVAGLDFIPAEAANAHEGFELPRTLNCFRHLLFALEFYHFPVSVLRLSAVRLTSYSSRFGNTAQDNNTFSANIFYVMLRSMAVELRIREAAEARGITTAYQLQKRMNVPPGTAARLWRGDMRMVGLDTIDALCDAIGCEPADLIVRITDSQKTARKTRAK